MKVEYYNPEEGNCIYRSLSKALNKKYEEITNELNQISNELNIDDIFDDKVFEKYMNNYNFSKIDNYDIDFLKNKFNGINIIYAKDKDWYHMICVIDNIIYDKFDLEKLKNMKIINVYKKQ